MDFILCSCIIFSFRKSIKKYVLKKKKKETGKYKKDKEKKWTKQNGKLRLM